MENGKEQAFPFVGSHSDEHPELITPLSLGLTKREYFAGLAMQGICAQSFNERKNKDIAENAVILADELLKALEKVEQS